jgi:ankyrin repeat protein
MSRIWFGSALHGPCRLARRSATRAPLMEHEYRDDDDDAMRPMIHRAAGRGDVATVMKLLDEDPGSLGTRNELNNQPLHKACWAKYPDVVRLLLRYGADVNARGDLGETPLHYAVRDGCPGPEAHEIARLLVDAGADIEAKDERLQQNPLGWALREFNDEMEPTIRMLLDRGSSVGLEGAMILGDIDRVRILLNEVEEQLPVELVCPVLQLSESCGQHEVAALIKSWLSRKQAEPDAAADGGA